MRDMKLAQATIYRLESDLHRAMADAYKADHSTYHVVVPFSEEIGGHHWRGIIEDMRKDEARWERSRPAGVPRSALSAAATVTLRMLQWVSEGAQRINGARDWPTSADILTTRYEACIAYALGHLMASRLPEHWTEEVDRLNMMELKGRTF